MRVSQKKYSQSEGWALVHDDGVDAASCQLVLAFGSRQLLENSSLCKEICDDYPNATVVFSSTAGEIIDILVLDDSISLTAIQFEHTQIKSAITNIHDEENSFAAGKRIASLFELDGLVNLLVLSDGQLVNGSNLVSGLQSALPRNILITGGLAGDGASFKSTLVGIGLPLIEGSIVAIGFYGQRLKITCGSFGGWDPFGPERLITKSLDNVLFELDNRPVLDIYKRYLGEYASELPSSGLLFPLAIRTNQMEVPLVRTILAIDETTNSLTFAGNMPEGSYARMMKANLGRLIEGAAHAAQNSLEGTSTQPNLAILISCVGRKLVLGQHVEEEIEAISNIYGKGTRLAGFYSYGEISPSSASTTCELHNQTMTITTFTEY